MMMFESAAAAARTIKFPGLPSNHGERVHRFSDENLPDLQKILRASNSEDAYCRSYLYYALTGRGTVWAIEHEDVWIICARHPNISRNLLIFFPFAKDAAQLEAQIRTLSHHPTFLSQFSRVLLARIAETTCNELFFGKKEIVLPGTRLRRVSEKVLDWVFPSYDVSLEKLAAGAGSDLACFRNKIRQFDARNVDVIALQEMKSSEIENAIRDISRAWLRNRLARKRGSSGRGHDDLIGPYDWLAKLNSPDLRCKRPDIDGIFLRRGSEYIAFSLWEEVPSCHDTVPSIAALPGSCERGLPEFLRFQMVKKLAARGYKTMCIGGSETAGLDHFKRKLAPIAKHRLYTIRLLLRHHRCGSGDDLRRLAVAA